MPVVAGRTSSADGTERTVGHRPPLLPTDCNTKQNTVTTLKRKPKRTLRKLGLDKFSTLALEIHCPAPNTPEQADQALLDF